MVSHGCRSTNTIKMDGAVMNHLMNCHGEWNMLFACASTMPILGVWIRYKIGGNHGESKCKETKDN